MGFRTTTPQQKRKAAIEERLKSDKEELVQSLLAGLKGVETEEIANAAEAFAWVRDERAIPDLLELLGHSDEWVRDRSGYALARMWRSALPLMDAAASQARHAKFEHLVRTFVRIGQPALPSLFQMLKGKVVAPQKLALKALCQIAFPPQSMLEVLSTSDDLLLGYAFEILGKSRNEEAIPLLLQHAPVGKASRKKQKVALGRLARHFSQQLASYFQNVETTEAQQRLICAALLSAGNPELVLELVAGVPHLEPEFHQANSRLKPSHS